MKDFLAAKYQKIPRTPMGEVSENAKKYSDIIDLSLGDPDINTAKEIIDAAFKDAYHGHTHYTEFLGDEELRQEISEFYRREYRLEYSLNSIMSVVGGCHGMYLILESICDPGDEILIHSPYFTPYTLQIDIAGGVSVEVPAYEKDGFELRAENLLDKITKKTKALILNYPNNPTGATISEENLKKIAEIVLEKDLLVISDEIYTSFSYDRVFTPISSLPGMKERTVIIGSFSKDYVMTGWRIGYVAANPSLINAIRDINEGICFTAPSISQRAAIHALKNRKHINQQIIDTYKKRIEYAHIRVNEISKLSVSKPRGTFYLFVNIKDTGLDSLTLSKKILEEAHVLVLPGSAFGTYGEGYIRIACTVDLDQLKIAFDRIAKMNIFS